MLLVDNSMKYVHTFTTNTLLNKIMPFIPHSTYISIIKIIIIIIVIVIPYLLLVQLECLIFCKAIDTNMMYIHVHDDMTCDLLV